MAPDKAVFNSSIAYKNMTSSYGLTETANLFV